MKMSRARVSAAAAVVLGVTVALACPPISAGAAGSALKPAGAAFVHVGGEGQTAYSVKVKSSTYKIKAPANAAVDWVGVVKGKGDRSGTYQPKELVKAWTSLGHRKGAGVQSTITWYAAGSKTMSFRSVKVSHPRINGKGELVFTATLNDGLPQALPPALPKFGINISRAQSQARGYPYYWPTVAITSSFGYQGSTGGDASGSVVFQSNDGSGWKNCAGGAISASGKSNANFKLAADFSCGGYNVWTGKTLVGYNLPYYPTSTRWTMLPCWDVTWGTSSNSRACAPTPFDWSSGGHPN